MSQQSPVVPLSTEVEAERYGDKAAWLSWLNEQGYNVPDAVFLPAVPTEDEDWLRKDAAAQEELFSRVCSWDDAEDDSFDLAIRSSATCEDKSGSSFAGHFESILGEMAEPEVVDGVERVIQSLDQPGVPDDCEMGVVVQDRIRPSYSGVVFSSNPVDGSKDEVVVSLTEGRGESLVSGRESGENVYISRADGELDVDGNEVPLSLGVLRRLYRTAKEIERTVDFPVDLEWCLEEETETLYYLQCRPATGILHRGDTVIPVNGERERDLPETIRNDNKVQLRLTAEKHGITVSDADIVVVECSGEEVTVPDLSDIEPSEDCQGYSAVLLHPQTVSGEVKRSFLPERHTVGEFVERCQRYLVRSYPDYDSLESHVGEIIDTYCDDYWNPVVIVQEILDPTHTGIIQRSGDEYVVEVGLGHFVPKGVVATSRYVVGPDGEVTFREETSQERQFLILDGYVIEEELRPEDGESAVPDSTLGTIAETFRPLLTSENVALEFGLREDDGDIEPFVIDLVEEDATRSVTSRDTTEGILSAGSTTGTVKRVDEDALEQESLDRHFHDETSSGGGTADEQSVIIHAEYPDISLLDIVERYPDDNVGFVFDNGSVLCHLAVILRERGIPALIRSDDHHLEDGREARVTARSDVPPGERIEYRE